MTAITHKHGCAHLYGSPAPPCTCGVMDSGGWCFDVEQALKSTELLVYYRADKLAVVAWRCDRHGDWMRDDGETDGGDPTPCYILTPDCWREIAAPEWPEVGK